MNTPKGIGTTDAHCSAVQMSATKTGNSLRIEGWAATHLPHGVHDCRSSSRRADCSYQRDGDGYPKLGAGAQTGIEPLTFD